MNKPLRHIGKRTDTGVRVAVIFPQLPGDEYSALIMNIDSLSNIDKDELLLVLNGDGQNYEMLGDALGKGNNILKIFHDKQLLERISIDKVVMTPSVEQEYKLRDILNSIRKDKGMTPLVEPGVIENNISSANPLAHDMKENITQRGDNEQIAQNILVQANLMQEEVNKKLEEAYRYAPDLRPPSVTSAEVENPQGDLFDHAENKDKNS